jgi:alkaline phosphatase D
VLDHEFYKYANLCSFFVVSILVTSGTATSFTMRLSILSAILCGSLAAASWDENINFKSPSKRHASLGLDMLKVLKRSTGIFKRSANAQYGHPASSSWSAQELNFTHGVASGDPYPHSVILWTRVSPMFENDDSNKTVEGVVPLYDHETEQYVQAASKRACVEYRVGTDKKLRRIVSRGKAYTTSDIDFTVKASWEDRQIPADTHWGQVEAKGLNPWTQYYYQFNVCGSNKKSPLGRTKTTPAADDSLAEASIAVFSCSNFRQSLRWQPFPKMQLIIDV